MSTHSQDGFMDVIIKAASHDPSRAPWDPPVGVGYGARIPNMAGDWDRFCGQNVDKRSACR